MPKMYEKKTLDEAILHLRKCKPARKKEKTKFNKKEMIEYLTPAIQTMRKRNFSYQEIVEKFMELDIHVNSKDIKQIFEEEQQDTPINATA